MRTRLLLPAIGAALLVMTACDFEDMGGSWERYHKDFQYSFPLKTGGRLAVETFNGSVEVSPWDQETVDISGTKYAPSQDEADNLKIDVDHSPDSVSIRVARPSMRYGNWGARFVIHVPRKTLVDRITTSNGSVRVTDGVGPARLKSSNGSMHLTGFRGDLDAQTSNSAIELLNVDGEVRLHTSNGHIKVDGLSGSLDATTSNSSIHAVLDRSNGPVHLESSNGSIDLTLPVSAVPVRASTSNSSITLHVPGSVNARLLARTSNGSISSDFDLRMQGEISKNHVDGVIGSGGGPLFDLSTSNGSIKLMKTM